MRPIYLDYNTTTPIAPSVQEAMLPFLAEHFGDPASQHALGRAAQEAIEDSRGRVAALLGCDRDEIVFTSGGTEACNLALLGVMLRQPPAGHLIISALEHPAVLEPARFLQRQGYSVTIVGCDKQGVVDPEAVESAMRADTRLVSIQHASHELGVVQPLRVISALCRARGILLHSDGVQSAGKIRTIAGELGVDLYSLSAHKFYGPKGIGALFVRRGTSLAPQMHGAGQEAGLRSGSENVPFIVALGQAAHLAARGLDDSQDRLAVLRDRLGRRLRDGIGGRLRELSDRAERLPNTLCVAFPEVSAYELLARLPELCASGASATQPHSTAVSSALDAIGLSAEAARGVVRLSVGWYTSEEEIDRAADLLLGAWEALQ